MLHSTAIISGRQGGISGVFYIQIYGKSAFFRFLDFGRHFLILYAIPEAREVSKNLPGARGFVVVQYEPVASHGDPVHPPNDVFF